MPKLGRVDRLAFVGLICRKFGALLVLVELADCFWEHWPALCQQNVKPSTSNCMTTLTPGCQAGGFTLLELMFGICAVALLFTIAIPSYRSTVEKQQVSRAVGDLGRIAQQLERYKTIHSFHLPLTLAELGAVPKDPWGQDYRYLNFADDSPGIKGKIRKDHNLHPLNSAFDLYSVGPDGDSHAPLTARASRDDILYARDGGFIGVATDF